MLHVRHRGSCGPGHVKAEQSASSRRPALESHVFPRRVCCLALQLLCILAAQRFKGISTVFPFPRACKSTANMGICELRRPLLTLLRRLTFTGTTRDCRFTDVLNLYLKMSLASTCLHNVAIPCYWAEACRTRGRAIDRESQNLCSSGMP
ncbi:hypothetical protein F4780DRAFT_202273 [Xylariomycetidae sp. FL0641]|nr:hypothetical protein F4780DRAFT_202273 [Xylariomycetidae sp. FL0641]